MTNERRKGLCPSPRSRAEAASLIVRPGGSRRKPEGGLKKHTEIIELLLERGARVDGRNSSGATALHDACLGGSRAVVELLVSRGAELDAQDVESGNTPLHLAASWGRIEALEALLDKGAQVNPRNKEGKTPLRLAVENGHELLAERLRRRGGKP